jgi:transcriptional regulator with XRE-family HTH domain
MLRYWSRTKSQNIVGPQIRKLRYQQELTQEMFAARCSLLGWDLSRGTLSKIKAQLRCVTDAELVILARALKVEPSAILSPKKTHS